ncbi:MAG: PilW family protein, partial [Puniceicoccales bacterium]
MQKRNHTCRGETKAKLGFTLVEIIISLAVFSIAMLVATTFFIDSYKTLFKSQTALEANRSSRAFMDAMVTDGLEADSFAIYPKLNSSVNKNNRVDPGEAGDFIILAETDLGTLSTLYTKLIGYYVKERSGDKYYDIIVFEYDVPKSRQDEPLEDLVNTAVSSAQTRTIFTE